VGDSLVILKTIGSPLVAAHSGANLLSANIVLGSLRS
jgi:hypothetical protein